MQSTSYSQKNPDWTAERRVAFRLTRFDRALVHVTLLGLSRVWRTILGTIIGWVAACTTVAGVLAWQMTARFSPAVWSRLPHAMQMRMLARYVDVAFTFPILIAATAVAGAFTAGLLAAPRPGQRVVEANDDGVTVQVEGRLIAIPWNAVSDVRRGVWAIVLRIGVESATVIPTRAFGDRTAGRRAYEEIRALWERRRTIVDTGFAVPSASFFLTSQEAHHAGRSYLGLTGRMRPWAAWTALGLVAATISAGTWAIFDGSGLAPMTAFLLAGATGFFAKRQDPAYGFSNRLREAQGDFCPMIVRLEPDAVVETAALGERRFAWSQITEIKEGKSLIVLRAGDVDAVVAPRRAFSSPRAADVFLRTAETYHAAAGGNSDAVWPPVPKAGQPF